MKKIKKRKEELKKYEKKGKQQRWKCDGFTFVETVCVLTISAIFATSATVSASKLIQLAKKTSAKTQIQEYCSALQSYFLDCGRFPSTEQGLLALWEKPTLFPLPDGWNGPYLERKIQKDPWGTEYEYFNAENSIMPEGIPEKLPFILISYGADKKKGGEGNNSDIYSWE